MSKDTGYGVTLDVNGRVLIGEPTEANTPIVGVLILAEFKLDADVVDIMTHGEIVDLGGTAGSVYYVRHDDGTLTTNSDPAGDGSIATTKVGWSVEADRLIVRMGT